MVNESGFTNSHDFEDGALKMMAAKIQSDAPFVGKTVMDAAMVYPGIKFMPAELKEVAPIMQLFPAEIQFSRVMTMFTLLLVMMG